MSLDLRDTRSRHSLTWPLNHPGSWSEPEKWRPGWKSRCRSFGRSCRKLSEKKLVRSFKGVREDTSWRGRQERSRCRRFWQREEVPIRSADALLGLEMCDDRYPCPLHPQWKDLRNRLKRASELRLSPIWCKTRSLPRSDGGKFAASRRESPRKLILRDWLTLTAKNFAREIGRVRRSPVETLVPVS